MRSFLTPGELRLALLFLGLAFLGFLARELREVSPAFDAWFSRPPIPIEESPARGRGHPKSSRPPRQETGPVESENPAERPLETKAVAEASQESAPKRPPDAPPTEETADNRVNPNLASLDELVTLPGIGPTLAGRILEERERGRFEGPVDLLRVKGVGRATLARLQPHLKFK